MTTRRILIALALAVAGLATAIPVFAVPALTGNNNDTLSVFKRHATAADRLPDALGNSGMSSHFRLVRVNGTLFALSRRVGAIAGWRVYAVAGRNAELCLAAVKQRDDGPFTRSSCSPLKQLNGSVISNWSWGPGGRTAYLSAIVANSVKAVEVNGHRTAVVDNAVNLALPARMTRLRLIGSGGRTVRLDLRY